MRKLFSLLAAVLFAGSMVAAVKEYTVTIGQSNFPGNSYAANNGVHKSTAVAADESTMEVEWTSNQVMWSSNKIQGQKNTGYIYNAASWGTVKSITINDNENFAFLIGSEAQPTATAEGGFFKISAGSATSKASSIVIVFDADASVPVLKANDVVLGTVIFEGESGSKLDSVAITAANLTEDIAVSTTSAKITLGATSVDKAGGVLKFTVNSGEGEINDTITLTSGELVAKVAVTGHFYAKVKNPGIAATFEAGPENSQGGDSTFVNGDKAVKAGTSNNAGSAVISLPANAVKLHFMAAAWNGKPCTMTLSTEDATLDVDSINLIADAGIANTSPFFTAEGDLTKYQHTVNISGADDDITIVATTKGTNKRFVIWDVTYEMSEEPQPAGLKAVSDSTTWDFAKVKAKTTSPLYSSSKEGILLTAETTPSITDEVIYADYDTTVLTIAAGFDAEAIAFTGEYPIRKDKYCMNGAVHFKTAVAGNIIVKFSDTGTSASATAVKRYLMVNGDSTQYWTSRENNGAEAPYAAQLNVVTEAIPVPAGDVVLTGSSAICVYYVTFIPDEPIIGAPEYYLAGDMNGWAANEAYKFAANPANEGEYMLTTALAVGDKFKVIGVVGATINWYPTGMGNDYVVDSLHAGEAKTIYFNPAGGQEGWYEGFFFVEENEETMDSIPTTAPAAPTAAEDDVLAIYCNHYTTNNLNFAISGWAGGYETLTIDSTKIGFWTNMTWECIIDPAPNTDNAHDFSAYKKLHVDFWAPKSAKIKFTVEAVAGGNYKDGQVVNLVKGWNSCDFVVAEWPDNYDFTNVKCFVLEQYQTPAGESFEGNPFAFANIYFYEKESQALDNTSDGVKAVKYIRNGMLLIEKNGKVYTITGQVVR